MAISERGMDEEDKRESGWRRGLTEREVCVGGIPGIPRLPLPHVDLLPDSDWSYIRKQVFVLTVVP